MLFRSVPAAGSLTADERKATEELALMYLKDRFTAAKAEQVLKSGLGAEQATIQGDERMLAGLAGPDRDAVIWGLAKLRAVLRAKHRQTAWVKAECRGSGANEEFRYVEVGLTQHPIASNLTPLLVSGAITVDLLMHELPTSRGGIRVRDHGYLFKIQPSEIASLFPQPRTITLIEP